MHFSTNTFSRFFFAIVFFYPIYPYVLDKKLELENLKANTDYRASVVGITATNEETAAVTVGFHTGKY